MPHHPTEIPAAGHEHFAPKSGDIVDYYFEDAELSARTLAGHKGMFDRLDGLKPPFSPLGRRVRSPEMAEAIGEYLAEQHKRISRQWSGDREFDQPTRTRDKRART